MSGAPVKGPWRWLSPDTLMEDWGHRHVVITDSRNGLAECGADGLLHPVDVDGPRARAIAAVPDLLLALKACVKGMEVWGSQGDGIPEADEGEWGQIGKAYEAACDLIARLEPECCAHGIPLDSTVPCLSCDEEKAPELTTEQEIGERR